MILSKEDLQKLQSLIASVLADCVGSATLPRKPAKLLYSYSYDISKEQK